MRAIEPWIDPSALIMLVLANSAPVILARIFGHRFSAAIDANILLRDGRPLFGSHKTWRGFSGGTFVSGVAGSLLSPELITGAAFGALALIGDLFSSFLKRCLGRASGRWTPLLDQLPEALLPMTILRDRMGLGATAIVSTAAVFTALDLIFTRR